MNIAMILVTSSLILFSIGTSIISVSRDLVRLLIGMETMFLAGLLALSLLYLANPIKSSILAFAYIATSIMETTLMIGLIYYLARSGYSVIEEKEEVEESI